jgi:hypothetical protein
MGPDRKLYLLRGNARKGTSMTIQLTADQADEIESALRPLDLDQQDAVRWSLFAVLSDRRDATAIDSGELTAMVRGLKRRARMLFGSELNDRSLRRRETKPVQNANSGQVWR